MRELAATLVEENRLLATQLEARKSEVCISVGCKQNFEIGLLELLLTPAFAFFYYAGVAPAG